MAEKAPAVLVGEHPPAIHFFFLDTAGRNHELLTCALASLGDLVRSRQQRGRDGEAEGSGFGHGKHFELVSTSLLVLELHIFIGGPDRHRNQIDGVIGNARSDTD